MKSCLLLVILASASLLLALGCGTSGDDAEPSYADLVVIYNAELATLDRLERKKADLIADYEKQLQPDAEEALRALSGALNSTDLSGDPQDAESPTGEQDDLDRAVEHAERMQQATSQLLEAAASQAEGGSSELYSEEFKSQLAAIDQEIVEQKVRVERARKARDAAEPNAK